MKIKFTGIFIQSFSFLFGACSLVCCRILSGQAADIHFRPLFHAGCYYVQEASSMFVEQALRRYVGEGPVVMLDLCAAPGGNPRMPVACCPQQSAGGQ